MAPFIRRSARGVGPFLEWRVSLFVVGATLAVGGMYLDERWLVGLAILVLAGGMGLRFLPGGEGAGRDEDPDEEEAGDPESMGETGAPGSPSADEEPGRGVDEEDPR